ncbi:MAG TPA: tetraacyldisaccharide 4'-kinase [Pseudidiomarina sp.]|nr:tetraacyldisaccharide 4'-kinase [Pseudidiomarina sp.]
MWWQRAWYRVGVHPVLWLLWPLQALYRYIAHRRRQQFLQHSPESIAVPVVVVGNITVGGAGKTPTVIALVEWLQAQGYRPGVIARGYGGSGPFPHQVTASTPATMVGDEPRLIVLRTGVTMVVDPNRKRAAEKLLSIDPNISIIVSDDGLQHYNLARDIEIVVVDGERHLGNHQLLPLGPLRELTKRLLEVDFVVQNGGDEGALEPLVTDVYRFELITQEWRRVSDGQPIAKIPEGHVIAIAGIANPDRFFATLSHLGQAVSGHHAFADHHPFVLADFDAWHAADAILMTEKDAVKCQSFAPDHWYYLPVAAQFKPSFWLHFQRRVEAVSAVRSQ